MIAINIGNLITTYKQQYTFLVTVHSIICVTFCYVWDVIFKNP